MSTNLEPQVIIRLGSHSEKDYLLKTIKFVDGLIIGANLIEATPGASASFILTMCGQRYVKPYFVDPMTYAFGPYIDPEVQKRRVDLDWIKSDQKIKGKEVRALKRSYRQLAERLEGVFDAAITRGRAITSDDLSDSSKLKKTCASVVEYQLNRVASEFQDDPEFADYADLIPRPAAVFTPYFYIESTRGDEGLNLLFRMAKSTVGLKPPVPVHAVICADESLLSDSDFLARLANNLPQTGVDGVWLWFSRFYEETADTAKLISYKKLVQSLSKKISVHNLHGGYFSLALSKWGLSNVSHGIGYGEQKDVMPVIGQSTPMVRYYLPGIHKRLGVPQIQACFNGLGISRPTDFYNKICGCVVCRGVVVNDISEFSAFGDLHRSTPRSKRLAQTPAAAKRCRFHFMMSRIGERDWIRKASLNEVLGKLDRASLTWSGLASLRSQTTHLGRWREALS